MDEPRSYSLARPVRSYEFLDPQQEARDEAATVRHKAVTLKGDYRLLIPLAFSFKFSFPQKGISVNTQ
jgi:hypothetical protein